MITEHYTEYTHTHTHRDRETDRQRQQTETETERKTKQQSLLSRSTNKKSDEQVGTKAGRHILIITPAVYALWIRSLVVDRTVYTFSVTGAAVYAVLNTLRALWRIYRG